MRLLSRYLMLINKLRLKAGLETLTINRLVRDLRKLLITILVLEALLLSLVMTLHKFGINYLITLSIVLPITVLILYHLRYIALSLSRSKGVETELRYFIIGESITVNENTELIRDLINSKNCPTIFRYLSREALKLKKLRKLLPSFEAVRYYFKSIGSSFVKDLLSDYMLASTLGAGHIWIQERGKELLNDIKINSLSAIKLRTTISIIIAILLAYIPLFSIMIAVITGSGDFIVNSMIMSLSLTLASLLLIPKPPIHNVMYLRSKHKALLSMLPIASALSLYFITKSALYSLLSYSLASIMLGIPGIISYINALSELSDLPRILNLISEIPATLLNPLKALNNVLRKAKSKGLRSLRVSLSTDTCSESTMKSLNLWLTRFTLFVLINGIRRGTLSRERLLRLREVISELISQVKTSFLANSVIIILTLALPLIFASVITISSTYTLNLSVVLSYAILSIILYSVYSSYIVFGTPTNTLLPGLSTMLLIVACRGYLT